MLRLRTLLTRSLTPAAACAIIVAACGASQSASATSSTATAAAARSTQTLYIYSGLPHSGIEKADSAQIEQGIRFALAQKHHQVGGYRLRYVALRDSARATRSAHSRHKGKAVTPRLGWSEWPTVSAAETAAKNPQTVAYIGDLDSGATKLSLPILNQGGIVQLTPGSGYPGLTDKVAGVTQTASPPEPDRYYPHGRGSLLRLIPDDNVQLAAAVYWLKKHTACHTVAAASFGADAATSTAWLQAIERTAKAYGLDFEQVAPPPTDTKKYGIYVAGLRGKVNCFMLAGQVTPAAVALTTALHSYLLPNGPILGTSGFCNPRWTDAADGGVAPAVDASLLCTTPALPLQEYPGGRKFAADFRSHEHRRPGAYTYYGYFAASLVMAAVGDIGIDANNRQSVMSNLINNVSIPDALRSYTFDSVSGDLEWNKYGLDRVVGRVPRIYRVLDQPSALPAS